MDHIVEVRTKGASCSCGAELETQTGAEAQRKAYQHARAKAAIGEQGRIVDLRLCSMLCLQEAVASGQEKPRVHDPDCFNHHIVEKPGSWTPGGEADVRTI